MDGVPRQDGLARIPRWSFVFRFVLFCFPHGIPYVFFWGVGCGGPWMVFVKKKGVRSVRSLPE